MDDSRRLHANPLEVGRPVAAASNTLNVECSMLNVESLMVAPGLCARIVLVAAVSLKTSVMGDIPSRRAARGRRL